MRLINTPVQARLLAVGLCAGEGRHGQKPVYMKWLQWCLGL